MKAIIFAASAVFCLLSAPIAQAAEVYTAATTVKQLWSQDYKGVKFVYFTLNNSQFFGFPMNHDMAEVWFSQLQSAMLTNHKAISIGYNDDPATKIDAKTKSGIFPFFHMGIYLDGGP